METPKKRIQGKRWCFTINNPEDGEYLNINWGVFGGCQLERGSNMGTLHIQGFVLFNTNQTMKSVKVLHSRAHWELMNGELEKNEEYCSKEFNKDGSVAREPGTEPRVWGTRPAGRRHSQRFERHISADSFGICQPDFTFLEDEACGGYCPGINREISAWYQGVDPITEFDL